MRHKLIKFICLILTAIVSFSVLFGGLASAAYYGAGTSSNPYRITDCSDLQNIQNNLSAYYVLVANINCSGTTFNSIATTSFFTGTLNGQDHSIENLNISTTNNGGLFFETDNATIENLDIVSGSAGSTSSNDYVGSFVGEATNTQLVNDHSSMSINGADYIGGLVGLSFGGTSISQSSYNGTLTGGIYVGGLEGLADGSTNNTITNSYSAGTINAVTIDLGSPEAPEYIGGILGLDDATGTSIAEVYSSATINFGSGAGFAGGLISSTETSTSFTNSFSATTFAGSGIGGTYMDAVFGVQVGTVSNIYYDQYLAAGEACYDAGSGSCTAENSGNSSPSYFKDTFSAGPLGSWNFNTIWSTTSSYPTLDNQSDFTSQSGIPNNGDANGDSIADSYEANVGSVEDSSDVWATVVLPSNDECSLGNVAASSNSSVTGDSGYTPDTSLISFNAYCSSADLSVPVTIIFNKQLDINDATLLFYNTSSSTYSVIPGAVFGTESIGGTTVTTVSYSLSDSGIFSSDYNASGLITDPVEIATPDSDVRAPSTGFGANNTSLFTAATYVAMFSICLVLIGLGLRKYGSKS